MHKKDLRKLLLPEIGVFILVIGFLLRFLLVSDNIPISSSFWENKQTLSLLIHLLLVAIVLLSILQSICIRLTQKYFTKFLFVLYAISIILVFMLVTFVCQYMAISA